MIMSEGCGDIDIYVCCGLEWGVKLILQSLQGQKLGGTWRPPHLQWTTMGWLPVLICNLVTSLITSMMVLRLEHLPSGSQLIMWNCVTWWAFHDCSKRKNHTAGKLHKGSMFFHTFYKPNCEKKTVTGVQQVKTASQVQYIGCRWQAVFVLTITEH